MRSARGATGWLGKVLYSALRIPHSALSVFGPIFEKELRVSSRRVHTHVVRTVYLLGLLAFLVAVWGGSVGHLPASPVERLARMPEAAKVMVAAVVWFQFVASQALAVVMLSTSIGEEVRRRTLGVLITTPITGLQIVAGKLLSRLFQVLLLVAASVPALLLVRIFGGVPADFLAGGICLTLAMVLLAGAISLSFSIDGSRPEMVILKTLMALGILAALVPLLIASGFNGFDFTPTATEEAGWMSPYVALAYMTDGLVSRGPTVAAIARPGAWLAPFVTVLGLALAVIAVAAVRVRRAAMRQVTAGAPADSASSCAAGHGGGARRREAPAGGPPRSAHHRVARLLAGGPRPAGPAHRPPPRAGGRRPGRAWTDLRLSPSRTSPQ